MKLIIVDFKNKKVAREFTLEELQTDYKLEFENLINDFHSTYNLKEIKKFNFSKNYKVINKTLRKAS